MLQVCTNDLVPHAVGMPACPECGCTTAVLQDSPEHEALLADRAAPKKPAPKRPGDKSGEAAS